MLPVLFFYFLKKGESSFIKGEPRNDPGMHRLRLPLQQHPASNPQF